MITAFPEFKQISVSDRRDVEAFTHAYPPYSDFNFTSLWAWDTSNERMISLLNDNLVTRFTDYATHERFLSFLGQNDTERTSRTLLEYSKVNGMPEELRLVPEVSIKDIRPSVVQIQEDRDNFDYICSIPQHARFLGGDYKRSRNFVNVFKREYPSAHAEAIDLADGKTQADLLNVIDLWEHNKITNSREYDLEHEKKAIQRLFATANDHTLIVTAVFVEDAIGAFSIDELLRNQYGISHFQKADTVHKGIYDFLIQEKAKHFETLGAEYVNLEQDLGIENLRRSKMAYRPINFLKKYRITWQ